ncbi:Gldg family protein [Riemerella columbina]|nr:Gldg family protein [Riemerella columbina]WKS94838.1 Gldg family protein [Riemerella columbina]
MKVGIKNKFWWIGAAVVLLLGCLGVWYQRLDLTQEKRYTLSDATVEVLKSVKKPLKIEIYLDGDFPASFKQLQSETQFMVEAFRKINPKIDYTFIDPIKTKMSQDTLMAMGMSPSILPDMKDGKVSEIVLFPYAVFKYDGYGASTSLIVQQMGIDANQQLAQSIDHLEYNLVSQIKNLTENHKKKHRYFSQSR